MIFAGRYKQPKAVYLFSNMLFRPRVDVPGFCSPSAEQFWGVGGYVVSSPHGFSGCGSFMRIYREEEFIERHGGRGIEFWTECQQKGCT